MHDYYLTVVGPDAVKNLKATFVDSNTGTFSFAIILSWDPIPEPEPGVTRDNMTLSPELFQAFVRNITYQVNITDNSGRLVNSSNTNSTSIVIDINTTPCNYYNISVISIINFELKYSGLEAKLGLIYPYEGIY